MSVSDNDINDKNGNLNNISHCSSMSVDQKLKRERSFPGPVDVDVMVHYSSMDCGDIPLPDQEPNSTFLGDTFPNSSTLDTASIASDMGSSDHLYSSSLITHNVSNNRSAASMEVPISSQPVGYQSEAQSTFPAAENNILSESHMNGSLADLNSSRPYVTSPPVPQTVSPFHSESFVSLTTSSRKCTSSQPLPISAIPATCARFNSSETTKKISQISNQSGIHTSDSISLSPPRGISLDNQLSSIEGASSSVSSESIVDNRSSIGTEMKSNNAEMKSSFKDDLAGGINITYPLSGMWQSDSPYVEGPHYEMSRISSPMGLPRQLSAYSDSDSGYSSPPVSSTGAKYSDLHHDPSKTAPMALPPRKGSGGYFGSEMDTSISSSNRMYDLHLRTYHHHLNEIVPVSMSGTTSMDHSFIHNVTASQRSVGHDPSFQTFVVNEDASAFHPSSLRMSSHHTVSHHPSQNSMCQSENIRIQSDQGKSNCDHSCLETVNPYVDQSQPGKNRIYYRRGSDTAGSHAHLVADVTGVSDSQPYQKISLHNCNNSLNSNPSTQYHQHSRMNMNGITLSSISLNDNLNSNTSSNSILENENSSQQQEFSAYSIPASIPRSSSIVYSGSHGSLSSLTPIPSSNVNPICSASNLPKTGVHSNNITPLSLEREKTSSPAASKTRICRYFLSRSNNHFGSSCVFLHPCRNIVLEGKCKHGKRCTDDHICRSNLFDPVNSECLRNGSECPLQHITHPSDRDALMEMFGGWLEVKKHEVSTAEVVGTKEIAKALVEQSILSSSAAMEDLGRRVACPFWYPDTQAGCKAGRECVYYHAGTLQLPSRPLPTATQLRFAEKGWAKRVLQETANLQQNPSDPVMLANLRKSQASHQATLNELKLASRLELLNQSGVTSMNYGKNHQFVGNSGNGIRVCDSSASISSLGSNSGGSEFSTPILHSVPISTSNHNLSSLNLNQLAEAHIHTGRHSTNPYLPHPQVALLPPNMPPQHFQVPQHTSLPVPSGYHSSISSGSGLLQSPLPPPPLPPSPPPPPPPPPSIHPYSSSNYPQQYRMNGSFSHSPLSQTSHSLTLNHPHGLPVGMNHGSSGGYSEIAHHSPVMPPHPNTQSISVSMLRSNTSSPVVLSPPYPPPIGPASRQVSATSVGSNGSFGHINTSPLHPSHSSHLVPISSNSCAPQGHHYAHHGAHFATHVPPPVLNYNIDDSNSTMMVHNRNVMSQINQNNNFHRSHLNPEAIAQNQQFQRSEKVNGYSNGAVSTPVNGLESSSNFFPSANFLAPMRSSSSAPVANDVYVSDGGLSDSRLAWTEHGSL